METESEKPPCNNVSALKEAHVENHLVSGVFTSSAALLFLRSTFTAYESISGSQVPAIIEALYVYYCDEQIEWMSVIDRNGGVRQLLVFDRKDFGFQVLADSEKTEYREACWYC